MVKWAIYGLIIAHFGVWGIVGIILITAFASVWSGIYTGGR